MSRLKSFNLQFAFGGVTNAVLPCSSTLGPPLVFAAVATVTFTNAQSCFSLVVSYQSWLSAWGFLQCITTPAWELRGVTPQGTALNQWEESQWVNALDSAPSGAFLEGALYLLALGVETELPGPAVTLIVYPYISVFFPGSLFSPPHQAFLVYLSNKLPAIKVELRLCLLGTEIKIGAYPVYLYLFLQTWVSFYS